MLLPGVHAQEGQGRGGYEQVPEMRLWKGMPFLPRVAARPGAPQEMGGEAAT